LFETVVRAALSQKTTKTKGKRKKGGKSAPETNLVPVPPVLPKGVPAPWINIGQYLSTTIKLIINTFIPHFSFHLSLSLSFSLSVIILCILLISLCYRNSKNR
jgi:uncharacterized protein involved in cysteine biosynthesis